MNISIDYIKKNEWKVCKQQKIEYIRKAKSECT